MEAETKMEQGQKYSRLMGSRAYLCGCIDREPDAGAGWRDMITPFLSDLGVIVFNPLKKPLDVGLEDDDSRAERKVWKTSGKFKKFTKVMKKVRHADMRMVDSSDFLICNLDLNSHPVGTYRELFLANDERKPIIIRCVQGKSAVPDWLFGEIPHHFFFSTWQEVKDYLVHVNSADKVKRRKRWLFFDIAEQTRRVLTKDIRLSNEELVAMTGLAVAYEQIRKVADGTEAMGIAAQRINQAQLALALRVAARLEPEVWGKHKAA